MLAPRTRTTGKMEHRFNNMDIWKLTSLFALIGVALLCTVPSAAAQESKLDQIEESRTLMKQAEALHDKGFGPAAVPLAERAVALREKSLGSEHLETAASFNLLGRIYRDLFEFKRAEPLIKHGLAIREKNLGPNHRE